MESRTRKKGKHTILFLAELFSFISVGYLFATDRPYWMFLMLFLGLVIAFWLGQELKNG